MSRWALEFVPCFMEKGLLALSVTFCSFECTLSSANSSRELQQLQTNHRLGLFNEFSQSCGAFFPDACTTAHHSNEKSVCYKGRKCKGWILVGWATGTGRGLWVAAQRSSGGAAGGKWACFEPFEKVIQLISSLYIFLSCRPASPLETGDLSHPTPYIPNLSCVQFLLQHRIVEAYIYSFYLF